LSSDKQQVIEAILDNLTCELELALAAANNARATATNKENIAENKYDTLGLEAAYLAHGQSNRAQRLSDEKKAFAALQGDAASESVSLGSLVCTQYEDGTTRWLFIGPGAAGLSLTLADFSVVVVTPESPLGGTLMGLSLDDSAVFNGSEFEIVDLN
jgi:transcription elongation GreA/GreB family factor